MSLLVLLTLDAQAAAPPALTASCDAMWTSQPLEGYLGVAGADGGLLVWSDPVPTHGVSLWVCASRPAYAWLWRVLPDGTPVLVWPLGSNVLPLSPATPAVIPQASLIGADDAHNLLLALTPTPDRPTPITGFTWMAMGADPVVHLALPGWPQQALWEPIALGPQTLSGKRATR